MWTIKGPLPFKSSWSLSSIIRRSHYVTARIIDYCTHGTHGRVRVLRIPWIRDMAACWVTNMMKLPSLGLHRLDFVVLS